MKKKVITGDRLLTTGMLLAVSGMIANSANMFIGLSNRSALVIISIALQLLGAIALIMALSRFVNERERKKPDIGTDKINSPCGE